MDLDNYLNIVEVGINTLLALIGVVIAILQYKNEIRENKRKKEQALVEEKNINMIKKIATQTESVKKFHKIQECKEKIGPSIGDPMNFPKLFPLFQEMSLFYDDFLEEIEPLYKQLVVNESSFSVSYGYGRYIDTFREFLLSKKDSEEFVKMIFILSKINISGEGIDDKNVLQQNRDYFLKVYSECNILFEKLCDNVDKVVAMVNEIKIKYEDYIDNTNA